MTCTQEEKAMKRRKNLHRLELLVVVLLTVIDLQQALRDLLPM
jgi:hypothetical protein